jgi:hypothetical protein
VEFDSTLDWTIIAPRGPRWTGGPAESAADELALWIGRLRAAAGRPAPASAVLAGDADAPAGDRPVFVLDLSGHGDGFEGYSWRAGPDRIELYGDSPKGLLNAVYDFLDALGWRWPAPGDDRLIAAPGAAPERWPLARPGLYARTPPAPLGLALDADAYKRFGPAWAEWAARNRLSALFLRAEIGAAAFDSPLDRVLRRRRGLEETAARYGVALELGGRCLSKLLPRRLFYRDKELFRMSAGRRSADRNFCPTNPGTVELIRDQARQRFKPYPAVAVFHVWPDPAEAAGSGASGGSGGAATGSGASGGRSAWCACPACRAFTPDEQALIALNAVADALAAVAPEARLSLPPDGPGAAESPARGGGDPADADDAEAAVRPRPNLRPYRAYPKLEWTGSAAESCRPVWIAGRAAWLAGVSDTPEESAAADWRSALAANRR